MIVKKEREILIVFYCIACFFIWRTQGNARKWTLPGSQRTDLLCPERCQTRLHPSSCCACLSVPGWKMGFTRGRRLLAIVDQPSKKSIVKAMYSSNSLHYLPGELHYTVNTIGNDLMAMPNNLCQFPSIVSINMEYNFIEKIEFISCLQNLDTLNLKGNRVRSITKETFSRNVNLRTLDLSYNNLVYVEPGTVHELTASIIYLNNNLLSAVDVFDMALDRVFCILDLSWNRIREIKNDKGVQIDLSHDVQYGPGYVDMSNNSLTIIPEVRMFGIKNMLTTGKLTNFGFDFRNNKLVCNCKLIWYLKRFLHYFRILKRVYFNIRCYYPAHLRGVNIVSLLSSVLLEDLVCNYSSSQLCPNRCHCYRHYQYLSRPIDVTNIVPRTVINCTSTDLQKMPDKLPPDDNLHLLFSNNAIKFLEYRNYLRNVSVLDISSNSLQQISTQAITSLQSADQILLDNNPGLTKLPKSFSSYDPCLLLSQGSLDLKCGCSDQWMKDWLAIYNSQKCNISSHLRCSTEHGLVDVVDYLGSLKCDDARFLYLAAGLGSTCSIAVVLFLLLFHFRYETLIVLRYFKRSRAEDEFDFDFFISFDETGDLVRRWILHSLAAKLEATGFRTYIPVRDMTFGSVRKDEVSKMISKSKNFLIILTNEYFSNETTCNWTYFEWQSIWSNYIDSRNRELIIVDFDFLRTKGPFLSRKFKAVLRIGNVLNFFDNETVMCEKLQCLVGSSILSLKEDNTS